MSASAAPFGFRPAYHPSGLDRARPYTIVSGYATQIANHDPVTVGLTTALGTVVVGGTTGDLLGVLIGCQWLDSTNKPVISNYWPATQTGTQIIAWVLDDPVAVFEAQTDGTFNAIANVASATNFLQGAIGGQMNAVNMSAANVTTGISQAKLAGSTLIATGGPAQFRVLEAGQQVDNNFLTDTFVIFQVEIAQHVYRANKNAV